MVVCGALEMLILLDCEAMERLNPTPSNRNLPTMPRLNLQGVLADQPVALDIRLRPTALSLSELATLTVGDVITLDHPLGAPVALTTRNGQRVCSARLATDHDRLALAVELEK